MKYFVTVIQKKADDSYSSSIFRYDTLDAAKVKAYTELAYAFGSDLALGAVQITDDYLNVLFKDVYTKPEPVKTETEETATDATTETTTNTTAGTTDNTTGTTDTVTDTGASESGTSTTTDTAAENETTGKA